ncbi:MAG: ParB N-terminal domain-containing protein [Marmoricola sp.]
MSDAHGHIELERRVDSIKVGVRHRSDAERDLAPLMRSIKRLGLLQPVTITPDGVLVCGHRRLAAVKQLGWPTLRVWVRTGVSDHLTQLLAEQDENTMHRPLSPLDAARLYRELKDAPGRGRRPPAAGDPVRRRPTVKKATVVPIRHHRTPNRESRATKRPRW